MKSPLLQFMSRLENCMKLIWIGSFNVYISDIIDEQCFVSYKKEQVQTFFSNFAFRDLKKKTVRYSKIAFMRSQELSCYQVFRKCV